MQALTGQWLSPPLFRGPSVWLLLCLEGERLESPGLAPILALPRTQWESWASPVPSSFSLCKLGAGVADEEVSEDSFQDPVEGENPNSADC